MGTFKKVVRRTLRDSTGSAVTSLLAGPLLDPALRGIARKNLGDTTGRNPPVPEDEADPEEVERERRKAALTQFRVRSSQGRTSLLGTGGNLAEQNRRNALGTPLLSNRSLG
ncbi:MAG: hypothetical protein AAF430_22090 [Myxococcota bacterium]